MNNKVVTPAPQPPRHPRDRVEAKQRLEERIKAGVPAPDITKLSIEDIEIIDVIFHRTFVVAGLTVAKLETEEREQQQTEPQTFHDAHAALT